MDRMGLDGNLWRLLITVSHSFVQEISPIQYVEISKPDWIQMKCYQEVCHNGCEHEQNEERKDWRGQLRMRLIQFWPHVIALVKCLASQLRFHLQAGLSQVAHWVTEIIIELIFGRVHISAEKITKLRIHSPVKRLVKKNSKKSKKYNMFLTKLVVAEFQIFWGITGAFPLTFWGLFGFFTTVCSSILAQTRL